MNCYCLCFLQWTDIVLVDMGHQSIQVIIRKLALPSGTEARNGQGQGESDEHDANAATDQSQCNGQEFRIGIGHRFIVHQILTIRIHVALDLISRLVTCKFRIGGKGILGLSDASCLIQRGIAQLCTTVALGPSGHTRILHRTLGTFHDTVVVTVLVARSVLLHHRFIAQTRVQHNQKERGDTDEGNGQQGEEHEQGEVTGVLATVVQLVFPFVGYDHVNMMMIGEYCGCGGWVFWVGWLG